MAHYDLSPEVGRARLNHPRNRARNLSHEERVRIGVEAHFATAKDVAAKWGLSPQTVTQIKNGAIQTAEQRKSDTGRADALRDEIKELVAEQRKTIVQESTNKLLMAMGHITTERLAGESVRTAAAVARDLATVAEKAANLGEDKNGNFQGPQVHVYIPPEIKEKDLGEPLLVEAERIK